MLQVVSAPFLLFSALPAVILLYALFFLLKYGSISSFVASRRDSKGSFVDKSPEWLTVAAEEARAGRPSMLSQDYLKKPTLLALAKEAFKSEQQRVRLSQKRLTFTALHKEKDKEADDDEEEVDKVDELLRHELRIKRNVFWATERVKRTSYRAVANHRLFKENCSRYRYPKFDNSQLSTNAVINSIPNVVFSQDIKKREMEKNRRHPDASPYE